MSDLREFLARALTAHGALVEPIEPDGLEIMAPPHLQQALDLPEWSRVGFGSELPERAIRVSFESDWAGRLERLLGKRGRFAHVVLQRRFNTLSHLELERLVQREFVLQNATLRVGRTEETRAQYLVLAFYATALSDEKREDIVYLCVNESNGALADDLVHPLFSYLQEQPEAGRQDDPAPAIPWDAGQTRSLATGLLAPRIRAQLSPFLAGMERRMSRDLERLQIYHSDLRRETAARLAERSRKGGSVEALEADRMRLQAIEREYQAKVADLIRKYDMSVEVRFLAALRAEVEVRRAEVTVLRRKGSRQTHLDWNPIARRLDHLPCEGCRTSPRVYSVCDDRLHWLCPSCLSSCASCGREACRVCNPSKCPKCASPWMKETGAAVH